MFAHLLLLLTEFYRSTPCSAVSAGATDASGDPHKDIMSHVTKRRLDQKGEALGTSVSSKVGNTVTGHEDLHSRRNEALARGEDTRVAGDGHGQVKPLGAEDHTGKCLSCFGAAPAGECCNTCEQVREAYRKKGWSFDPEGVEQCQQAGFVADLQSSGGEGCALVGYVQVPKVTGEFHFAPSHGFSLAHTYIQDLASFTFENFNNTHRWNSLTFGAAVPGKPAPLTMHTEVLPKGVSGAHQYYLKVVPTTYTDLRGRVTDSNQYSVTQHFKHLDKSSGQGLPGVYVNYDFSPIHVSIQEQSRSFGHFMTSMCAIIGGTVTIMSMLDKGTHSALQWLEQRRTGRRFVSAPKGLL